MYIEKFQKIFYLKELLRKKNHIYMETFYMETLWHNIECNCTCPWRKGGATVGKQILKVFIKENIFKTIKPEEIESPYTVQMQVLWKSFTNWTKGKAMYGYWKNLYILMMLPMSLLF
jgi:hypothetical protein